MSRLLLISLFLIFITPVLANEYNPSPYYSDGENKKEWSSLDNNNLNHYTKIGDTYYSPSGTSYTQQGNQIYGSDGSSYTRYGSTVQNNSNGSSYQINNNFIQPLY